MLEAVKLAIPVSTDYYDAELQLLIDAALADLGLVGIDVSSADALVTRAVITYCKSHFGSPGNYEDLKASYDEQKAQLLTATGYGL